MNTKFQNALNKTPQQTPPIWFMRQAGRYHSHYQGLRAQHTFEEMCKNPELAAQVALGPIMDFDFDTAILFSDILYPLEALGMGLQFTEQGPRLGFQLDLESIKKLTSVEKAVDFMQFQKKAVQATREVLPKDKSLIGFIGGPWTLFVYAVEGSHSGALIKSKTLAPHLFPVFMEKMESLLAQNIQLQLDGGAEIVMIFDTAAGEVSPIFFKKYLVPVLEKLVNRFPKKIGYYSKGTQISFFEDSFLNLPWVGMGFDHRWNLSNAFQIYQRGFVQGNFDQSLLHLDKDTFKKELDAYLQPIKALTLEQRAGWVCGLGHGVLPKTPEENVRYFVNRVREVFS